MDILTILLIAAGLAMDCFAVSLSAGITLRKTALSYKLKVAALFGGFQAGMTLAGWLGGSTFASYIETFDHWIAFCLLAFVGGKMIYEALHEKEEKCNYCSNRTLVMLAVATSIDALAVGVSFAFLKAPVILSAALIGSMSFLAPIAGISIGEKAGERLGSKAEIAGGIVLIIIGLKILIEHIFF